MTTRFTRFECETIEAIAEELCFDIVDLEMVTAYIDAFGYITKDDATDEWLTAEAMLRINLRKWIDDACEYNYGNGFTGFDAGAQFAEYYFENYMTEIGEIPSWLVIDWQGSWDRNLCHDFTITENGYVFVDH